MKYYSPNATASSLLGFLYDQPMTGWDVMKKAQKVIGEFWPLTQSQVYRELQTLEEHGFIKPEKQGQRERQPFSITPAGKKAFLTWLHETPEREILRYPLLIKLTFGQHLKPESLQTFLEFHRKMHQKQLLGYQSLYKRLQSQEPDKRFIYATLDLGIRYEKSVLAWLKNLPNILNKHSKEGDINSTHE